MRTERGSGLLLTLFLTLLGAMLLGLAIDATSLVWARMNLQTAVDIGADAVALELRTNPAASKPFLEQTARAVIRRNVRGWDPVRDSVVIEGEALRVRHEAGIYFLRMIRSEPFALEVRGKVART